MLVLELVVCVLSFGGFAFLLINSVVMPYPQTFWDGPGAFPAVLSTVLLIVCIIWFLDLMRQFRESKETGMKNKAEAESKDAAAVEAEQKKKKERRSFLIMSVLTILYVMVLMPLMPFPIATFIFLTASFLLFSKGKWWQSLIISTCMSVAVYLVFTYVLHLPMPN